MVRTEGYDQLVIAAQQGDAGSNKKLFTLNQGKVFVFSEEMITRNAGDAEDILQETFIMPGVKLAPFGRQGHLRSGSDYC